MKKSLLLIILLLLLLTMTGCAKGKKALKTLTCEYSFKEDVTDNVNTTLKITFNQDRNSYELVKGTVEFNVSFASGLSSSDMSDLKKSLNEQFCEEDFFGEGTNKSCKIKTETKTATVTIEVDTDKLVASDEEIELNETTLDDLKTTIEGNFGNEVKCTIN